uniref:LPS-assembly protein LptD n=1 Tax=Sphingomonas bacterium TaxID=1895847 RepID=UPI001575EEA0
AAPADAQDLQTRAVPPPAPEAPAAPLAADQVQFSSDALEYDDRADIVTATGNVRMFRQGQRLRADRITWNRKTGKVLAAGNVAVVNPQGDTAYGDSIDLTDSLKDGVVDNMLVVLSRGGRIAAARGTRQDDGTLVLSNAAYTACDVTGADGCPKQPTWKITAVRVTYDPSASRIYYSGAHLHLFDFISLPLPSLSNPVGGQSSSGLLSPEIRLNRVNGFEVAAPYFIRLAPDRSLTLTPHLYTGSLPMAEASYQALSTAGAFRLTGYATVSRRSDDLISGSTGTQESFRGYIDGVARFQLSPEWSISGSARLVTDKTFLRRYDLTYDDRLRTTARIERIDDKSYLSIDGWYVQTLRIDDAQKFQPIALPEVDYRRRVDDPLLGGKIEGEVNTLALTRIAGQDTQRAFASLRWDLRRLTTLGQEVTFTAYARGDLYHTSDTLADAVPVYRGLEGFQGRAIGALAVDVQWPFAGTIGGGIQTVIPRVQIVASPKIKNLSIPNEDSRAVDLDDTNLFALNRFPGYDRYEDSSRATYGISWNLAFPGLTVDNQIGQSFRFADRSALFFPGTGLSDKFSDVVGRTEVRYRELVSLAVRYRIDKDDLTVRRAEIDATVGSSSTYLLLGYLRLNRDIEPLFEDLQDHEEGRVAGRVQFSRYWSAFGSILIDLTDREESPLSTADGFSPIRHRVGVAYEDNCLKLGLTWKRDYATTGDARRGNSYLLSLSFKNLGR